MQQEIKSIKLENFVKLSYFEKGSPDGIPLIMIPGLADSWRIFELLLPYISESIHLFALSQRGHGDSSRPVAGYRTDDFVADLALFMAAVNIDKAIILGASSGGFTARNFAIHHPDQTRGLILLGSPATLQGIVAVQEIWDTTISKLTDPVSKEFVESFNRNLYSKDVPRSFIDMMLQENLKVSAKVWRDTMSGILTEPFSEQLVNITAPTMIVWGNQDKLLTRSSQEAMATLIPNAQLIVHKNTGHLVYCDEPQGVANDIRSFIQATVEMRFDE